MADSSLNASACACSIKRIALVSARYKPLVGGVEQFTYKLASALCARGYEVDIITSHLTDDSIGKSIEDGLVVWRLPSYSLIGGRLPILKRGGICKDIERQLLERNYDAVVVNTRFYALSLWGMRLAHKLGLRAIVIEHGSQYLTLGSSFKDAIIRTYEHCITWLGKRYRPVYAGISHMACKWLTTFGITSNLVIPNALDVAEFKEEASQRDFRRELDIAAETPFVVCTGRLCPEKGVVTLAQAAQAFPEVAFVFAGEGPQRSDIEDLGLDNAFLLGNISHADLSALLQQAQIFCLPTRSEGFSTALLEAAATGCIPVIPRVGGVDEVLYIQDRCLGVVLGDRDPDAVREGLRHALELMHDMQVKQQIEDHVAQSCSWDKTVDSLLHALKRCG